MTKPLESSALAARTVRCPRCGGDSVYSAANPYRPFCSAHCKNIDFGAWASEAYRVATTPDPNDPEAPAHAEPPLPH